MKKLLVALLLISGLLSACSRRTHASTGKTWNLSLTKPGDSPRAVLSYRWKDQARLSCGLEIQASSRQVDVPRDVTLILSLGLVDDNVNRTVLAVQLEDLVTGDGKRPALWTKPVGFEWVVTKRGRTLSFQQDSETVPVVLSGLPDLALLVSRMVPTFPVQDIGSGAVWSKRSSRSLTIPGPTGTGRVEAGDAITYELKQSESGRFVIDAKGAARYQGKMHPVGHMLTLDGRGTFTTKTHVYDGILKESTLQADEKIELTTDGVQRTVETHYEARLRCRTAGSAESLESPHLGRLSQRFVTPKAMAGRHH